MQQAIVKRAENVLTKMQQSQRQRLETVIETALRYHLEAAAALLRIRDERLYRDTHDTFEQYCAERWGISRAQGNRLCDWAVVSENVSPIGDKAPLRESHARPLARLTPQQQRKAWRRLLDLPHHTEHVVEKVCDEVRSLPVNGKGAVVPVVASVANQDRLPSPLPWFGGKAMLARQIIGLLSPHEVYIEPFFGGGSIFFAKVQSKIEIINDTHGNIVNLLRILRDADKAAKLKRLLQLTPYSREEHDWCRDHPDDADKLEQARRFYVRVRQSYAYEEDGTRARRLDPNGSRVGDWCASVDRLDLFVERLRKVQIECLDFRKLLPECDREGAVVYADPPYLLETRTRHATPYRHEMTVDDHADLLDLLCGFRHANVVLSGYDSNFYNKRLKGWRRYEFPQKSKSTNGKQDKRPSRTEVVWVFCRTG